MERFVPPLLTLLAAVRPRAAQTLARPGWDRHFAACNMRGTFVLLDPAAEQCLVCNEPRARERLLPAATFEIAAALIGLEVGSITDENEVFAWDGRPKPVAAWERDHSLASGMRANAAWMFQEVARRTGRSRMREWLDRLDYGNRDMGGGIDLFWLQGRMRTSAMEQARFLRALAEGALPMSQRAQRLVRQALAVEKTPAYTLYAKGGIAHPAKEPVSWWVGWVERKGRPAAYFAMNFTPTRETRHEDRARVARAVLREAGFLPRTACSAAAAMQNIRH